MKTKYTITASILIAMLLAGCGTEYTITTHIFPNGSCERVMVATFEAREFSGDIFSIPIDSSWKGDTLYSTKQVNRFGEIKEVTVVTITVKKLFKSIEAMHMEFNNHAPDREKPNLSMQLNKKFKWFRSKYEYREVYEQQFPFKTYPVSHYLSPIEARIIFLEDPESDSIYFAGKDTLERTLLMKEMNHKAEDYIAENIFVEFYDQLSNLANQSNHSFFNTFSVQDSKDELLDILYPCFLIDTECEDTSAVQLLSQIDSYYKTDAFGSLAINNRTAFTDFDRKFQTDIFASIMDSYLHEVELPGKLISTNADSVNNSTAYWKFDLLSYAFSDHTMTVSSVKNNYWANILSLFVILGGVYFSLKARQTR